MTSARGARDDSAALLRFVPLRKATVPMRFLSARATLRLALATWLLSFSSLAAAPGDGASGGALSITANELLDHVKTLSADSFEGRASGTPAGWKAAEYVSERFRSYGLSPASADGTYLQPFEFSLGTRTKLGESCRLERVGGAAAAPETEWSPLAFSPQADVTGGLVFAGYGIVWEDEKYDDYAGIDVKGKVVLVIRHTPGDARSDTPWKDKAREFGAFFYKASRAQERGAAALVVVNDPKGDTEGKDPLVGVERRMPGSPTIPVVFAKRSVVEEWLEGSGLDLAAAQRKIDETLAPASREIAGVTVRVATEVVREERGQAKTANVIGILPGSDPVLRDECVVIGAHYDHVGIGEFGSMGNDMGEIHNGADDNASGTAALLELAQAFTASPEKPKRSIVFAAFAAEERGLLGSRHYVANPLVPIEKTVAMINLDMVGRSEDGLVEVIGVGTSPGFAADVERWNKDIGLVLKTQEGYSPDSDHAPFAGKQVPILFLFTGLHPDYHRPGDDWEKINSPDAARVTRLAHAGLSDLADRPARPEFVAVRSSFGRRRGGDDAARAGERGAAAPSATTGLPYLGLSAAESPDGKSGVVLSSVAEGGPAALAGLLGGDTVLSIGGRRVSTFEELRDVIASRKPGESIEVEIVRKVSVKVGERP